MGKNVMTKESDLNARIDMIVREVAYLGPMKRDIEKIMKSVYGNGSPGLDDRVVILENGVTALLKSNQSIKEQKDKKELISHEKRWDLILLVLSNVILIVINLIKLI
jgi:hypothetical protein